MPITRLPEDHHHQPPAILSAGQHTAQHQPAALVDVMNELHLHLTDALAQRSSQLDQLHVPRLQLRHLETRGIRAELSEQIAGS